MKKYSKFQKIFFTILPFVIIPVIFLLAKYISNYTHLFPECLIYSLTGIHCMGCGTTRAVVALLHGDIITSLRQNCLVIFGIIGCIWLYIEFLFYVYGKKPPFTILKYKYAWCVIIFIVIYTIVRNIFPVLAPF